MLPSLSTERLTLVPLTNDDYFDMELELDSDADVMRYITGSPRTTEQVKESHQKRLALIRESPSRGFWVGLVGDQPAGLWMLLPSKKGDAEAELGYRLLPRFWHKGYASEGARAIIKFAFTDLGLARIGAEAMAAHAGTRATLERLGLTFVGALDSEASRTSDSQDESNVEYAITRESWQDKNTQRQ